MVTIKEIFQALKTTQNFWDVLSFINPEKKVRVIFRNGCEAELNLQEYQQVLSILSKGYSIEVVDKFLCFKKNGAKIAGPLSLLNVLSEGLEEVYSVDCRNKIVLDIGGFIGDSAVFFSAAGAKKVIIYEPVVANHEFIKLNLSLNGINAELHDEGIGETDGYTMIHYDKIDVCFGLNNLGPNKMQIKIRSIRSVIEESCADLAKLDCEGAESALVSVPSEILRKIEFYIIEMHTLDIKKALVKKFRASGFVIVKEIPKIDDEKSSTVFFSRI